MALIAEKNMLDITQKCFYKDNLIFVYIFDSDSADNNSIKIGNI